MTHISPQINHLVMARPLSTSMSNLIRYLKSEVTAITEMEDDVPERDVRADSSRLVGLHLNALLLGLHRRNKYSTNAWTLMSETVSCLLIL